MQRKSNWANSLPRRSRAVSMIDALEPRRMLTATFSGTAGPDTIEIDYSFDDNEVHVIVNGVDNHTDDGLIIINALGGSDTVLVHATDPSLNVNYVVNAGDGDDFLMNPSRNLGVYIFASSFVYDGGPGFDTAIADNFNDLFVQDTQVSIFSGFGFPSGITRGGVEVFPELRTVERLEFIDNDANNEITFRLPEFEQVVISGNGGNDQFNNALLELEPALATNGTTIVGGGGTDALMLNDSFNNGVDRQITISAGTVQVQTSTMSKLLAYGGFESFNLLGGSLNDDVILLSKSPVLPMVIETRDGNDTVQVGGGDIDSGGFTLANTSIIAGNGIDSIEFDDRLDGIGETEAYTFSPFTLTKGGAGITYSAFETQSLLAADGGITPFLPNTININSFSGQIESSTITGGANRPNTVNLGSGQIPIVDLAINLGAAGGTINFNDQSASAARSYQISATEMTSPAPISFSGATAVNLNGGPLSDNISITGSAAGTSVVVNADSGSDSITLGQGNIDADLGGPVTINGGAGANTLTINNSLDPAAEVQTLTSATFTDGLTHGYISMPLLIVNEGPGGTTLDVNSISIATTINGGSGDDTIRIGNGNLNSNLLANVTLNGNGGNDSLQILDQSTVAGRTHTFDVGSLYRFGTISTGKTITFGTIEAASLQCGSGNDSVEVVMSNIPITVHTGGEVNPGPTGFPAGDNLSAGSLGPATVIVGQTDTVINLSVGFGLLRIPSGVVLQRVTPFIDFGLSLAGVVDIAGALLWRGGGSTPNFRGFLSNGRNNGAWNGVSTAINSSLAAGSAQSDGVGYGLGSEIAPTTIGGFAIAATDTLLRYTLDGDTDLSGTTDIADFSRVAANFNGTNKVWTTGDSNYDNATDIGDFSLLGANFNQSVAARHAADVGSPAPGLPRPAALSAFSRRLIEDIL